MAGERIGTVAAGITIDPLPAECGQRFARLHYAAGDEALAVIRRYDAYIDGPVNDRLMRCWRFSEAQRKGLEARK